MKEIAILFHLKSSLSEDILTQYINEWTCITYHFSLYDVTETSTMKTLFSKWQSAPPHAIVTIDLAGFNCRTIGINNVFNHIPTNMLHYLSSLDKYKEDNFDGMFTLSTIFLCAKEDDCHSLIRINPFIHHVLAVNSIKDELIPILNTIDYRISDESNLYTV